MKQFMLLIFLIFSSISCGDPPKEKSVLTKQSTHTTPTSTKAPDTRPPEVAAKETLENALQSKNAQIRLLAVQALARIDTDETKSIMAKALYDSHPMVRTFAAAVLARRGEVNGLPLLKDAVQNKAGLKARALAITTMRHLPAEIAIPNLTLCIENEDKEFLLSCATALSFLENAEGDALLEELAKNPDVQRNLAFHLRFLKKERGIALLKTLFENKNVSPDVLALALISGSFWGEELAPFLQKALASRDIGLRSVATVSLLARGKEAPAEIITSAVQNDRARPLLSLLVKRLEKPDARLLSTVPPALRVIPEGLAFAFQTLQRLEKENIYLEDPKPLFALIEQVPSLLPDSESQASSSSRPTSLPEVKEQNMETIKRNLALKSAALLGAAYLANQGEPTGTKILQKALDWPLASNGLIAAIQSLHGPKSFVLLETAAKHPSGKARLAAAKNLLPELENGEKRAMPLFETFLQDDHTFVRVEGLLALEHFPTENAISLARPLVNDLLDPVKITAAFAILAALSPDKTTSPPFKEELEKGLDPE